jgi:hypothetical protein
MVSFNKSGNTSITTTFAAGLDVLRGVDTDGWPEPFVTLAYFRHPLARLASVYNYFFELPRRVALKSSYVQPTPFRESFENMGFNKDMTFEDFCDHIIERSTSMLSEDLHLKRQSESFREHMGNPVDIWIGRLDEINVTWPQMVDTWGLECCRGISQHNRQTYSWTEMYEDIPDKAALLEYIYKDDYAVWSRRRGTEA